MGPVLDERQQVRFGWEGGENVSTSTARLGGHVIARNCVRTPLTEFSRQEASANWAILSVSLADLPALPDPNLSCSLLFTNRSDVSVTAFIRIHDGDTYVASGDSSEIPAGHTRRLMLENILLSNAAQYFQVRVFGTYVNLPVSVSQVMVNEGTALPFFSGSSGPRESMRLYEALRYEGSP